MTHLLLALLALSRVPAWTEAASSRERKNSNLRPARFGDVTYMVWMGDEDGPRCGCVVISDTWAITVASCALRHLASDADITAPTKNSSQTVHRIGVVIVHHSFSEMEGNIALVQVKDPFSTNKNVQIVELPLQDEELAHNAKAVVTARRVATLDEEDGPRSDLKNLSVDIESHEQCQDNPIFSGSFTITNNMICAHRNTNTAYKEEIGSALVVRSRRRVKLVGLLSWVHYSEQRAVAIYTRLAPYRLWIRLKTGA